MGMHSDDIIEEIMTQVAKYYESTYYQSAITLVMMGGPYAPPPQSVFIFLPKISPPDQTLRSTCKFLILGLLYHEFFFLLKI